MEALASRWVWPISVGLSGDSIGASDDGGAASFASVVSTSVLLDGEAFPSR
jgi:hypothetical protein